MLMFYCWNSEARKHQVELRCSGVGKSPKQDTRK